MNTPQITIEPLFVPRRDGTQCPAGYLAKAAEHCTYGITPQSAEENLIKKIKQEKENEI